MSQTGGVIAMVFLGGMYLLTMLWKDTWQQEAAERRKQLAEEAGLVFAQWAKKDRELFDQWFAIPASNKEARELLRSEMRENDEFWNNYQRS